MAQAWAMLTTAEAHLQSVARTPAVASSATCPQTATVPKVPFTPVLTCFPGSPGLTAPNPAQCPEPGTLGGIPVPAATWPDHPPGAGYAIPFVASVGNVVLLTSYNAYTAAYPSKVQNSSDNNFNEPWQVVAYNITAWVTGLLQLPSLQATIQPDQVVFCTPKFGPRATQCPSHLASTGCAWFALFNPGPTVASAGFNGDCTKHNTTLPGVAGNCLSYTITLAPDPRQAPQLTVLGLNPADQLEVSATTAADETLYSNAYSPPVTCVANRPTKLTLSTEPSTGVPSTGPPAPPTGSFQGVPIPDDRPLQLPFSAISGPIRSIHAALASNQFQVPAFWPQDQDPHQNPTCGTAWFLLNIQAAGLTKSLKSYYPACDIFSPTQQRCHPYLAAPGFAQASGQTSIVRIDIPSQPPPGFNF